MIPLATSEGAIQDATNTPYVSPRDRARGGGVVRIWRLPPVGGLDDGQDRRAGVRR